LALQTSHHHADCINPIIYRAYAVVGFGEAKPPQMPLFPVVSAAQPPIQRERQVLWRANALQTSRLAGTV
jgi:hypothetical protein